GGGGRCVGRHPRALPHRYRTGGAAAGAAAPRRPASGECRRQRQPRRAAHPRCRPARARSDPISRDDPGLLALRPAILRIRDSSLAAVTPGWLGPPDRVRLADLAAKSAPTPDEKIQLQLLRERAMAGPLASLVAVLAEQVQVLQEDIEQLYDDAFIETCAEWVVPYIGDLIGYRSLHGVTAKVASPRAEVAHTIAFRRRKGTVSVLEQLANDVTGWGAEAGEVFPYPVLTQYMNHRRPQALAAPDLRAWEPVERLGTAFDTICHTVDVRPIASRRGRYNIPNVGVFLWRLSACPPSRSPAAPGVGRRWRFPPPDTPPPLFPHSRLVYESASI